MFYLAHFIGAHHWDWTGIRSESYFFQEFFRFFQRHFFKHRASFDYLDLITKMFSEESFEVDKVVGRRIKNGKVIFLCVFLYFHSRIVFFFTKHVVIFSMIFVVNFCCRQNIRSSGLVIPTYTMNGFHSKIRNATKKSRNMKCRCSK